MNQQRMLNKVSVSFLSLFIYFEGEGTREREGGREHEQRRGRERESQAGCAPSAQSLMWGLNSGTVRS